MDGASVAAILAALGVGGLAGSWLRARHELTERFRERMIAAAETFLTHVEAVKHAMDDAFRVISDDGIVVDHDAMRAALAQADRAMLIADGDIARLYIVFPQRRGRGADAHGAADRYVEAMREVSQMLSQVQPGGKVDTEALQRAVMNAGYSHGQFSRAAAEVIWRRWL